MHQIQEKAKPNKPFVIFKSSMRKTIYFDINSLMPMQYFGIFKWHKFCVFIPVALPAVSEGMDTSRRQAQGCRTSLKPSPGTCHWEGRAWVHAKKERDPAFSPSQATYKHK